MSSNAWRPGREESDGEGGFWGSGRRMSYKTEGQKMSEKRGMRGKTRNRVERARRAD
jgi:hypothetical protein